MPMPKSARSSRPDASPAHHGFLSHGCGRHWNEFTVSRSGFVAPISVSSPSTATTLSPSNTSLPRYTASGNSATLKKSFDRRCSFTSSWPMSMLDVSTCTSTEPVCASWSMVAVPVLWLNLPRNIEMPMCGTSMLGYVWSASSR